MDRDVVFPIFKGTVLLTFAKDALYGTASVEPKVITIDRDVHTKHQYWEVIDRLRGDDNAEDAVIFYEGEDIKSVLTEISNT